MTAIIRPGEQRDLGALTEIYNHYIRSSHATFDTVEFSESERQAWFDSHQTSHHRLLVADMGGEAVGYATSGQFRAKPAYGGSVETTVYVSPDRLGLGIGRQVYGHLLDELVSVAELHRAYAGVAMPNDASVALHRSLGFEPVGTFSDAGFKFDRYVDVQWFERSIDGP